MDLGGQVAVVTGGGRGIGRATALALAGAGAGVCVCARTAEEIEAVADEVRRLGRPALAVPCDVADPAQVQALADRTIATLGRADILVNNAGGGQEKSKVGADDADRWRHTVEVNLIGLYLVTRAFLPHIIADGGGKIINIGSGMGHAPVPGELLLCRGESGGVDVHASAGAGGLGARRGGQRDRPWPGGHSSDGWPYARGRATALRPQRAGQAARGGGRPGALAGHAAAGWADRAIIQPRPPTAVTGAPTQRGTRSGSRGWRR